MRRELMQAGSSAGAKQSATVLRILPGAAAPFRKQIATGLDDDRKAALEARPMLRELFCGRIDLKAEKDGLFACYGVQPATTSPAGVGGTSSEADDCGFGSRRLPGTGEAGR